MIAAPSAAQLPRTGDIVAGKYVLDQLIGQGGMGAVFSARHIKLSKAVAIKIMLADAGNPEAAQRFINEGRAAANIQNEHVVRVDDVDEELGYAYMVLELLDGEDLAQVLEREPAHRLPPHVAVGYVVQALRGVMQAHQIGIVHRDLKPSNLFLARRKDGSALVKVLDFGISKAQGSSALAASPSALTSTKAMLGSPLYMSPEQLRSSKSVDHRADIWAMGVILYELMTGRLPFMGDNLGELFAAILETDPLPVGRWVDGVHPALDEVALRCLQRRPEQRFQSAAELAQALAPFADPMLGSTLPVSQSTAFMPPQSHAGHPVAAMTSSPSSIGGQPRMPGAIMSGWGPRSIQGTVALGALTPQHGMQHQTGGGWQSSGPLPKSRTPMIALASGGLVVVVAIAFAGMHKYYRPKVTVTDDATAASASASAALANVPPPPTVDPHPSAAVELPPAPPPAPTVSAAAALTPVSKGPVRHPPGSKEPLTSKEPHTADPPPPAPPPVVTPPKPKASSGSPYWDPTR